MPTQDTAELIISCKAKGVENVERVNVAVERADKACNELIKTMGRLVSAATVFKTFKDSVKVFVDNEKAAMALDSALRAVGKTNAAYRRELEGMNESLARVTVYTTAELAAVQSLGLNMGITSDQIAEATRAAIGFSAAYGRDLSSSMRLLALAANGDYTMLRRMGFQMDRNVSTAENFSALLKRLSGNMGIAEDQTKTAGGALTMMNKSLDDARAKVGEQLVPYVREAAGVVGGLADKFAAASPVFQRFVAVTGAVSMTMLALKAAIGLKTIADTLSGKKGVEASQTKQKETKQEIALEKALQKEKLATIAVEQARAKVETARKGVRAAENSRAAVMNGTGIGGRVNLDSIQAADNGVAAAKEQLAAAEKELQKLEAAQIKAANGAAVLKSANQQLTPSIDAVAAAERKVAEAEAASEKAAQALMAADQKKAAARQRIAESTRGVSESSAAWRANLDDQGAYSEVRSQRQKLDIAQGDYDAARSEVARLKKEFNKANAAVEAANAELKALGTTSKTAGAGLQTLGTSASTAGKQVGFMRRQFTTFPTFAKGARAVASGVRTVGVACRGAALAAKSLMTSMLPMMAISAAIAGVDYLINRSKVAAEGANALAMSRFEDAQKKSSDYAARVQEDNEKIQTLEMLSKYTRLTNDEQNTAKDIINELSKSYGNLAGAVQLVNGKLIINQGLNQKISEQLKKEQRKLLKRELATAEDTNMTMMKSFFGLHGSTNWDHIKQGARMMVGMGDTQQKQLVTLIQKSSYFTGEDRISELKKARDYALSTGEMVEQADYIQKMMDHEQKLLDIKKKIADFDKGDDSGEQKKKKIMENAKDLADLGKARDAIDAKKWSMDYETADSEGKTNMLQKKIGELTRKRDDALERAPDDRKKQTEAIKLSEKLIELERQKAGIMADADQKRVEHLQRAAKEEEAFMMWAMRATFSLKATTQNAIEASSVDAMKLQSRSMDDANSGLLTAVSSAADAARAATEAAEKSVEIQRKLKSVIDNIYTKIANIGTSEVG